MFKLGIQHFSIYIGAGTDLIISNWPPVCRNNIDSVLSLLVLLLRCSRRVFMLCRTRKYKSRSNSISLKSNSLYAKPEPYM